MESLLEALASSVVTPTADPEIDDRLELLLADFLACVSASRGHPDAGPFQPDGVMGTAGLLALRCSAADLDDIDWRSMHHPGSVVWPVVVSLAASSGVSGGRLGRAARSGYATAATIADHLGPAHRATWHVTATAGALGAATAASVMLDLSPETHARALALAAVNAGGLALAARERRGAAAFNRAAATTLGLMAARAASSGAIAVQSPIDGPGGLAEAMSGGVRTARGSVREGIRDAAPRIYPVTGFLQSAVDSVAALRSRVDGELRGIHITLAEGVCPLVDDGTAGPWWDARLSALRAWSSGSPFGAGTPCERDGEGSLVHLHGGDLPSGHSDVTVVTDAGEASIAAAAPPALSDRGVPAALEEKWTRILGCEGPWARELAQAVLTEPGRGVELREAWSS